MRSSRLFSVVVLGVGLLVVSGELTGVAQSAKPGSGGGVVGGDGSGFEG